MCVVGLAVALGQFEMWACSADNLLRRRSAGGVGVGPYGVVVQMRYRYRVEPTVTQQRMLARVFGCVRVVFNDQDAQGRWLSDHCPVGIDLQIR